MPNSATRSAVRRGRRGHDLQPRRMLQRPEPRAAVRGDARSIRNALIILCLGAAMSASGVGVGVGVG